MEQTKVRFAFRPRPFAAETVLDLTHREINASRAGKDTRILCSDIATIRLFYAPRGINFSGFKAKIYTRTGKTVAFEDRSFKGLIEQERLEQPYRIFVETLCKRAETANPNVLLYAGKSMPMLVIIGILGSATALLAGYFSIQSLLGGQYVMGASVAGFTGYFAAWTATFVRRNWPQVFRAAAIPPGILPDKPAA